MAVLNPVVRDDERVAAGGDADRLGRKDQAALAGEGALADVAVGLLGLEPPAEGPVGPGRGARIARGPFPRAARRTRRAILTAPGSPRVVVVQPVVAVGVHGVGIW